MFGRRSVVALSVLVACSGGAASSSETLEPAGDGGAKHDGSRADAAPDDATAGDTNATDARSDDGHVTDVVLPSCPTKTWGRGLAWTRKEPMFVSAMTVGVPAPDTNAVTEYFGAFGANAVHTWADGLPSRIAAFRAANVPGFRYVSWVNADGTSTETGTFMGGIAHPSQGRIGFQIGDEPLEMPALDTMLATAATIRAADPDALLIVNFADTDNLDALLTKAVADPNVDVVSEDRYAYKDEQYRALSLLRKHGLASGKPYWRYADSYSQNADPSPSETDMRWDAMVGLLYGFTGFSWFIYQAPAVGDLSSELFASGGSYAAAKTPRFAIASAINGELRTLGRVLTQLTSTDVRYVAGTPLAQPKNTQTWTKGAGAHPYLTGITTGNALDDVHAGFFSDDCGEPYVMLLNPKHDGAKWPVSMVGPVTATLTFDFSGATDPTLDESAVSVFDAKTGQTTTRALTKTGARQAKLEVTLAAAEVFFFKPKNGRSFAMQ